MSEHWVEYHEGKKAFDRTKSPEQLLPYNLNGVDRARALQWLEGWKAAKRDNDDDDDDAGGGGSGGGGWPSTTGNPSGGGRWNG
jgi:hypothetical protein